MNRENSFHPSRRALPAGQAEVGTMNIRPGARADKCGGHRLQSIFI